MGQLVATRGVADKMAESALFSEHVRQALHKYVQCDWGDTCEEDKQLNDEALICGDRILAVYKHATHEDWRIWIITEWDRSATTVLFPSEY